MADGSLLSSSTQFAQNESIGPILLYMFTCKEVRQPFAGKVEVKGRRMKNYNRQTFVRCLLVFNWKNFHKEKDVEKLWSIILKRINHVLDVMCPYTTYKAYKDSKPWLTPEIIGEMHHKDNEMQRAKRVGDSDRLKAAKRERNQVSKKAHKARKTFILDKAEENKNNQRNFWRELKKIIPQKKGEKDTIKLSDK